MSGLIESTKAAIQERRRRRLEEMTKAVVASGIYPGDEAMQAERIIESIDRRIKKDDYSAEND